MTDRQVKVVLTMLKDIKTASSDLPKGKYFKVYNRCEKIALIAKKSAIRK